MRAPYGWRASYLVREAVLDTFALSGRSVLAVIAAVLISSSTAAWAVWEAKAFEQSLLELGDRGRNVVVVASGSPDVVARISRASCESLSDLPGVARAGVVVPVGRSDVFPFGVDMPVFRVSSTLLPELVHSDAVVGSALASTPAGSEQRISIEEFAVVAVVGEREPPGIDINSGVSLPASLEEESAESCVAVLDHQADVATWTPSLLSNLDSSGPPLAAFPALRESTDARVAYLERATRFAPLVAGAFIGVLFGLITISRAAELATYRLSGTSVRELLLLLTVQGLLIGGVVSASATGACLILLPAGVDPGVIAVRSMEAGAGAALFSIALASSTAVRRPTDLAKDR